MSEIGAARKRQIGERMKAQGIGTIAPQQVLAILEELFSQPSAQVGVVPLDWSQFNQQSDFWQFLVDFQDVSKSLLEVEQPSDFLQELETTPVEKRHFLLVDHVRSQVAKVLGFSSSQPINLQQGFFDLGMDSLTAMELKNRLQTSLECELPSSSIFNYPTVESFVDYLERDVLSWKLVENDDTNLNNGEHEKTIDLSEVKQLSPDEVEVSIAQELADLEMLLRKN